MIPGDRMADKLLEEQVGATRAGDKFRLSVIRLLRAELQSGVIAKKAPLDAAEELAVLAGEVKRRQEAFGDYGRSVKKGLLGNLNQEFEMLKKYLLPQFAKDELSGMVWEAIAASGAPSKKDLGRLLNLLMPRARGKADGSEVPRIADCMFDSSPSFKAGLF